MTAHEYKASRSDSCLRDCMKQWLYNDYGKGSSPAIRMVVDTGTNNSINSTYI